METRAHSDAATPLLLLAGWIAPMDREPIRDGGLFVQSGRIFAVGPGKDLRAAYPQARVEHFDDCVLLPGLINAHTHLELTNYSARPVPSGGFAQWLIDLMKRMPADSADAAQSIRGAVTAGIEQCLRFGVTTVGDISRQCGISRPVLRASRLRGISFGEVQAMGQRRGLMETRLANAADQTDATDRLRIGISPHAPYSVEPDGYRHCLEVAAKEGLPLSTHLAETREEAEFLADHRGPLRDLWGWLGAWDEKVPKYSGGPIRLAQSLGLLDYPTVLAHVNCCDDQELALLAKGRASVVYCPRTHQYFGRPPHRWRDMLAAGVNVAIGTDSCASSPDLNLVDDLRLLHQIAPEMPVKNIWEMATIRAARALGLADTIGSLSPGKSADIVAFPSVAEDPLEEILQKAILPRHVWIDGR